MEAITIFYKGELLAIYQEVAKRLNIKAGYQIMSDAEFWYILGKNAQYGISICNAKLS